MQPLFHNPLIRDDEQNSFFNEHFIAGGIIRVADLMYEVMPSSLPAEAVHECISVANPDSPLSVIEIQDIITHLTGAFPHDWLSEIYSSDLVVSTQDDPQCNISFMNEGKTINATAITCKSAADMLRSTSDSSAKGEEYWKRQFPNISLNKRWKNIYKFPKTFHNADIDFRIIHNILDTNEKLHKFKIIDSPNCALCRAESESVSHLFIDCPMVNDLWRLIVSKLENVYSDFDTDQWRVTTLLGAGLPSKNLPGILIDYIFNCYKNTIWIARCALLDTNSAIINHSIKISDLFHSTLAKTLCMVFQVYQKNNTVASYINIFGQKNVVIQNCSNDEFTYVLNR